VSTKEVHVTICSLTRPAGEIVERDGRLELLGCERLLETGDAEQLVITNRNEPRAVLITVARYEELLRKTQPHAA
jgi:prevent-host-death family protein